MEPIKKRLWPRLHSRLGVAAIVSFAVTAVVAVVKFLAPIAIDNWVSDHVLTPFGNKWDYFVAQPTGRTLAFFAIAVLVLLALAILDTSPNGAVLRSLLWWRKDTKPKELTVLEVNEINYVRTMWLGDSQQACEFAMSAVEGAQRVLGLRPNRLAGLLQTQITRLRDAMNALGSSFQNGERRAEIEKRFAEVRAAYGQCVCWYNKCLLEDKSLLESDQTFFKLPQLKQWAVFHESFAKSIETLKKHNGFDGFCASLADDLYDMRSLDDPSGFQLVAGLDVKSR